MNKKEYLEHWITNLLSDETIKESTFEDWMWCPERYSPEELESIEFFYNDRRKELLNASNG